MVMRPWSTTAPTTCLFFLFSFPRTRRRLNNFLPSSCGGRHMKHIYVSIELISDWQYGSTLIYIYLQWPQELLQQKIP